MDIYRLFKASKIGDIETVKILIENKDVDINTRDKFDSTPLYYACLCGHIDLVRYLLANGARCDVNTFDGERCVYGALTGEIRKLLVYDYKVISKKVIRRNEYDEFLRKAFEYGEFHDIVFNVHGNIFKVHRCVLASRCQYFYDMFTNKWKNRKVIHINHVLVNVEAFKVLLYYLYTGILEFHITLINDVLSLMQQCRLYSTCVLEQKLYFFWKI